MFVSIIYLKIKYFIVFVFYLWYLFVASACVRLVSFSISSVSSSLLSERNLLVWFYNPLKCAVMERALPEQKKRTKLCIKVRSYYFYVLTFDLLNGEETASDK